jgi:ATP-dependent phosphofructokinase / diphosphate-dependent phosphofructokinase
VSPIAEMKPAATGARQGHFSRAASATTGRPSLWPGGFAVYQAGMSKRIGIVTGGGDCPGINSVIRAVAKAGALRGWEAVGIHGGFEGLIQPGGATVLDYRDLDGLLTRGGTILGSANSGRFAAKVGAGETRRLPEELLAETRAGVERLGLVGLVAIGGDGTMSIAVQLHEAGIPIVGVPKTIDNDLDATVQTFGFDTAVAYATDAVDRLHTTAESHGRAIVLEVMGRHAGWIALFSGLAGGADVILIPEIPFDMERVCDAVRARDAAGKHHTIVVVAEGARPRDGGSVLMTRTGADREERLGGVGQLVADAIQGRTGKESRVVVLGHLQRGGSPTHFDRALCTIFGATAVDLVAEEAFGRLVIFTGRGVDSVPLQEAVDRIRTVPADGAMVRAARAMGVCFGDG